MEAEEPQLEAYPQVEAIVDWCARRRLNIIEGRGLPGDVLLQQSQYLHTQCITVHPGQNSLAEEMVNANTYRQFNHPPGVSLDEWPITHRRVSTHPVAERNRVIDMNGRLLAIAPAINVNLIEPKLNRPPGQRCWYSPHDFIAMVSTSTIDQNEVNASAFQYLSRAIKAYFEGINPDRQITGFKFAPGTIVDEERCGQIYADIVYLPSRVYERLATLCYTM